MDQRTFRLRPAIRRRWPGLLTAYERAACTAEAIHRRDAFGRIETFVLFIGYPRSGHSLIGSLLDAHPEMVVCPGADVLHYVRAQFDRDQLFAALLRQDRRIMSRNRRLTGYEYAVPEQWQGRFRRLRVIGDQRGGATTDQLDQQPELLERLRQTLGVPLRLIHALRNPYDSISTMSRRSGAPLEVCVDRYFALASANGRIRQRLDQADALLDMRHESLIENPRSALESLCSFLGVDASEPYLEDCARIVFPAPKRRRYEAPWNSELIGAVRVRMAGFEFLRGYGWDD
jgi:hypothetical protein